MGLADRAAETAYVGDALDDMRMAVAAGARGIGIRTDLATAEELLEAGADEVAGSVAAWVEGSATLTTEALGWRHRAT